LPAPQLERSAMAPGALRDGSPDHTVYDAHAGRL